jgi:hypothetical protein
MPQIARGPVKPSLHCGLTFTSAPTLKIFKVELIINARCGAAAALHVQGFGAVSGIAIIVACLIVNQLAYLAACSLFIAARRSYSKNRPTLNQATVATRMLARTNSSDRDTHLGLSERRHAVSS